MNFKWKKEFNKGKHEARSQFKLGISANTWWAMTTGFLFDPKDPFDLGSAYACQLAVNRKTKAPWLRRAK